MEKKYRVEYDYTRNGERLWKEYDVVFESKLNECIGKLAKDRPRSTFRHYEVPPATVKAEPRQFFPKKKNKEPNEPRKTWTWIMQ